MKSTSAPLYITALMVFIVYGFTAQSQSHPLDGKWKLVAIQTDTGNRSIPETDRLFLNISKAEINYNLDINSCSTQFQWSETEISYTNVACSEVCCDPKYGHLIDYSGNYHIVDSLLTIENSRGTFRLYRIE